MFRLEVTPPNIYSVAVRILNKQSRTTDKVRSPILRIWHGRTNPHRKKNQRVIEYCVGTPSLMSVMELPVQRNKDIKLGTAYLNCSQIVTSCTLLNLTYFDYLAVHLVVWSAYRVERAHIAS